jgi:hypothetical protein
MSQTIQEKNKALVLDAFDTLFNERDYAAAEKPPCSQMTSWPRRPHESPMVRPSREIRP